MGISRTPRKSPAREPNWRLWKKGDQEALDLAHVDQAGFAPTLPTTYGWYPVGERLAVPYEAPQERRVNALGGYFSHGPLAGLFCYETWAKLPEDRAGKGSRSVEERAARHGVGAEEVGAIDAERVIAFFWRLAGRPEDAGDDWVRERPLHVVLDNYSVHHSRAVQEERRRLEAAGVHLFYLPAYAPELSAIEPIWQDVKHRQMPVRSYATLGELKRAVDAALDRKADILLTGR